MTTTTATFDQASISTPTAPTRAAAQPGISKAARIAGRVLTGLVSAFLLFDASIKLANVPEVAKSSAELGYPVETMIPISIVLLACLALYLIPRTAVVGAVLLTGYLGGAIATHVRVGNPLASHVLFPVYVAALIWGGLYLRDLRVRALLRPAPRS